MSRASEIPSCRIDLAREFPDNLWFDMSGGFVDDHHPPSGHGALPTGQAVRVFRKIGVEWIEDGVIDLGGRLPVNPSGGLIGVGHPVDATGMRQLLDAWRQVTGSAGATQVEGAQRVATLNMGGSGTTSVAMVIGR